MKAMGFEWDSMILVEPTLTQKILFPGCTMCLDAEASFRRFLTFQYQKINKNLNLPLKMQRASVTYLCNILVMKSMKMMCIEVHIVHEKRGQKNKLKRIPM